MWASLEHKLRYKTNVADEKVEHFENQLVEDANEIFKIESNMQNIYRELSDPRVFKDEG